MCTRTRAERECNKLREPAIWCRSTGPDVARRSPAEPTRAGQPKEFPLSPRASPGPTQCAARAGAGTTSAKIKRQGRE